MRSTSRANVPSITQPHRNKPVKQISVAKKPERQIPKGHRFSIKKTSVVHEKIMTPRSCLRWKPTGKIFKTVGLRWVPTGNIFTSSITKVDKNPQMVQMKISLTNMNVVLFTVGGGGGGRTTLDVSAGTLNLSAVMTSDHNSSELGIQDHINEPSSSKLVLKVVPPADKIAISQQELELIFSPMYEEYFNAGNQKHPSDTQVFTVKMEILLELTSNKLLVETKLRGRLLESFQEDAKYEHVGQDTRSQDGKDDQDKQGKDLKISESKTKSKDNDKGSRSKITKALREQGLTT
ncbi:hypothetical protein Tco_0654841 [Tanacetum coccineum]|uniref:Uncharacterized protein n=1 Tax=Tanacetum coccineum TaxID=301880 RepID=A0ABQ4X4L7_9ASTR